MAFNINPVVGNQKLFVLSRRDMVVRNDGAELTAFDFESLASLFSFSFGVSDENIVVAELKPDSVLPAGYSFKTIRDAFAQSSDDCVHDLSRARALASWVSSFNFCPSCGAPLNLCDDLNAKKCPKCSKIHFPRIEPCIIVLVYKGDKILLAKHANRNTDVYSCLAGFVEAGETVEHAVAREVFEETAIRVKNIRYRGCQSWPFPTQLMFAFTAEYESGEIQVQKDEIADADWFDADSCPATPNPGSVAYKLIHKLI